DLLGRVGAEVAKGRAVVIPDAFDRALADRMADALEATTRWLPHERYSDAFFHFRHHNLYERADFPRELDEFRSVMDGAATKDLVGRATRIDCSGPLTLGASLYLPGDYSLPHTDGVGTRSLAYVWYLTREWSPSWGGHFVWCPTGAIVSPTFNSLVLFRVSESSLHFVAPVAPTARGRRLAVNGWWHSADPPSHAAGPRDDWPVPLMLGSYGDGTS